MFLGSIFNFFHKSVDYFPFMKLSRVSWFIQLWLFSCFPEIRDPPFSGLDSNDGMGLMSCTTPLSSDSILSFFLQLKVPRVMSLATLFPMNPDEFPWIRTFSHSIDKDCAVLGKEVQVACLHQRFLVVGSPFLHSNSHRAYEFYNPTLFPYQFGFQPCIPSCALHYPHPLDDIICQEFLDNALSNWTCEHLFSMVPSFQSTVIPIPFPRSGGSIVGGLPNSRISPPWFIACWVQLVAKYPRRMLDAKMALKQFLQLPISRFCIPSNEIGFTLFSVKLIPRPPQAVGEMGQGLRITA